MTARAAAIESATSEYECMARQCSHRDLPDLCMLMWTKAVVPQIYSPAACQMLQLE